MRQQMKEKWKEKKNGIKISNWKIENEKWMLQRWAIEQNQGNRAHENEIHLSSTGERERERKKSEEWERISIGSTLTQNICKIINWKRKSIQYTFNERQEESSIDP